jgi:hypothetical protein
METKADWISALKKRKAEYEDKRQQLIMDANAYGGAVQDCDYWIAELEKADKPKEVEGGA